MVVRFLAQFERIIFIILFYFFLSVFYLFIIFFFVYAFFGFAVSCGGFQSWNRNEARGQLLLKRLHSQSAWRPAVLYSLPLHTASGFNPFFFIFKLTQYFSLHYSYSIFRDIFLILFPPKIKSNHFLFFFLITKIFINLIKTM